MGWQDDAVVSAKFAWAADPVVKAGAPLMPDEVVNLPPTDLGNSVMAGVNPYAAPRVNVDVAKNAAALAQNIGANPELAKSVMYSPAVKAAEATDAAARAVSTGRVAAAGERARANKVVQ